MSYLNEAFKELDELEDDVDLQSEEDVKKAMDFIKGDIDNTDHLEMVVDIDAETEDDLQDSYVGEILLMCPACHTLHYAHEEDIVTSEDEPDFVNVGEPCPHCKQENGFEIKGKVAEYVPEGEEPKEEENDDFDEMDIDTIEDEETEEEKAQFEESFKLRKKYVEEVAEDNLDDLARFTGIELPTTKRVTESKAKTLKENLTEAPIYDLKPSYDARKSFYGKAQVGTGDKGDKNRLYSYDTLVAEMKDGKPVVYGTYSQTTLRHIKEWLKQNGFKAENSKQIMADYGAKQESCNESTLDERNLTTAERQNKMMNDIFANFNKQADEMAKFLLDKGLTQEEVNDLKAHTGLGKHALGDKIEELGLHDEFFGKKESCEESVTKQDDIDAQADDKKEVAKQEFEKKIDDADADRDDKLKESKLEITESAHKMVVNDDKITIDEDTYDLLDSNDEYYLFQDKNGVQQEIRKDGKFDSEYYFGDDELEEACKTKEVKEEAKEEPCEGDNCEKKEKEPSNVLKESADNEYQKIIDRAKLIIDDGNVTEADEALWQALDEEPYLDDFEILQSLFRIDDLYVGNGNNYESVSTYITDDIYNNCIGDIEDYFNEKHGEVEEGVESKSASFRESITTKLNKTLKEGLEKEEVVEEDEFEESLFENLVNRYCTRVYENVDNYKATACSREDGKFIIEGMLTYKNGKQEPTKFTFTEGKSTKNIKKYIGLNETFSDYKKAFTLNMTKDGNKLLSESLYYNYNAKVEDKNYPIKGKVATPKTK